MSAPAPSPTVIWRCERCGSDTPGPENPGYAPYCPSCGDRLVRVPVTLPPLKPPAGA